MVRTCPNCGSTEIDEDAARGDATCTGCGTVLEESIVVTENQFQERAGGSGHTLVGQFVSAERAAANNFNGMGSQESREVTYAKGKKVIDELSSQLRINSHCLNTAFNFFKMCVQRNLTRGRNRSSVVAVCLYITCRLENTAHLLLDFSDVTQINVFDLGRNLNFISRSLRINLPATDPCLYIMRFACVLDFGEKQKEVVNLATRLVQRMKRDWMSTGRRPTGICGAALLIAARSLNFNRSIGDIVRVVHISESVIRKRLDEFSQTPSGSLTIDEFSTVDLEHSEDPPAYRDARRRAREDQLRKEAEQAESMADQLGVLEADVEAALEKKRKEKFSKSPFAKLVSEDLGLEKGGDEMVRTEILNTVFKAAEDEPSSIVGPPKWPNALR
uniref:TFIIB-type domain-containing protein n=2 Tax=Caenorhabditis japonica TaxID=281687 RepID=A0A8R1DVB7_CAEJA